MKQVTTDLRQDALKWWNELTDAKHRQLLKNMGIEIKTGYEGIFASDDEIEQIYLKETASSNDSLESPLGWRVNENDLYSIFDNNNNFVCECETKESAFLICEAVNNYNALKEINKELIEHLERVLDRIKENDLIPCFPSAYNRAEIALKKAKQL